MAITYSELCNAITQYQCSNENLNHLKINFECKIRSRRRLCQINNLSQLINVLQQRDVLSEEDVEALEEISAILSAGSLLPLIKNYQVVQAMPDNLPHICRDQVLRVLPQRPASKKEHAYIVISQEIGASWKKFARALEIRQAQIDELEEQYPRSIENRVLEILRYCDGDADPSLSDTWRSSLLNALYQARRNDLHLTVEYILNAS